MATIYQKTATDNALVLNPREYLLYPFNLGDWTEIRLGIQYSFIATNTGQGFNSTPVLESGSQSSFLNGFFMGFKDTGTTFPNTTGSTHIGFIYANGIDLEADPITAQRFQGDLTPGQGNQRDLPIGIITGTTTQYVSQQGGSFNFSRILWGINSSITGTESYAGQHCFQVTLTGKNTSGQFMTLNTASTHSVYVTPSITGLRSFMSALTNSVSGFSTPLTHNLQMGGTPISFPNAFFLYCPLLNNQFRLHTLLIERYQ